MSEYTGLFRGAVHDINDPENRGRIRALVPAALGDAPSGWAEPVLPTAERISWTVGDRVWILFEGGDLNHPVYISRMEVKTEDIAPGAVTPEAIGSDGARPSTSPAPEVIPGWGTFHLRWPAVPNEDPVVYDVHVSDEPAFAVGSTTRYASTSGTAMTVKRLPEEFPLEDKTFQFDAPYYFKVVARDPDGEADPGIEMTQILTRLPGTSIEAQSITGDRIVANSLYGELFSSQIATSATFTTGAYDETTGQISGARSEMGPNGIDTVDSLGRTIFHMPTDAGDQAYVRANLEAETLRILGGLSMEGTNNQLAVGSRLTLSEGISAPTSPPVLTASYPTTFLDVQTAAKTHDANNGDFGIHKLNPANITSICWNEVWNVWVVSEERSEGSRIWHFTTGGSLHSWNATNKTGWIDDYTGYSRTHLTADPWGDSFINYWEPANQFYIWGKTPTGATTINYIPKSWIVASTTRPALSYDYELNQYILAQSGANGMIVRRFTCVPAFLGNAVSQTLRTGSLLSRRSGRLIGFVHGAGTGTVRFAYATDNSLGVSVTNTPQDFSPINADGANEEFSLSGYSLGFTYSAARNGFFSVNANGQVTHYSNWTWLTSGERWFVGYTWYDPNPAGGTHETKIGGIVSLTAKKRARLKVRLDAGPSALGDDAATERRLYYARKETPPSESEFRLAATVSGTEAVLYEMLFDTTGTTPPPAQNNFPGATPAILDSAGFNSAGDPTWSLKGSGAGRMGPMEWDDDGNNINDTGWITFAPGCQYRIRNGMVTVNVYVSMTVPTGGPTILATLPEAVRPDVNLRTGAWLTGYGGAALVLTSGELQVYNQTGASRTNVGFFASYPKP